MYILIRALITFVVVLLVLSSAMTARQQIVRVIVIIIGVLSLLGYLVNF